MSMTDKERTALAMLKSGSSWKEVSDYTGITVSRLKALFEQAKK